MVKKPIVNQEECIVIAVTLRFVKDLIVGKQKKLWNPKEIESRTKNLAKEMIGIYNDAFLGL